MPKIDFKKLKKTGVRIYPASWMMINAIAKEKPRLGITISKKLGNAVLRNKLKRWARSIFFEKKNSLPKMCLNIVFREGKNYKDLKYNEFKKAIQKGLCLASKKIK